MTLAGRLRLPLLALLLCGLMASHVRGQVVPTEVNAGNSPFTNPAGSTLTSSSSTDPAVLINGSGLTLINQGTISNTGVDSGRVAIRMDGDSSITNGDVDAGAPATQEALIDGSVVILSTGGAMSSVRNNAVGTIRGDVRETGNSGVILANEGVWSSITGTLLSLGDGGDDDVTLGKIATGTSVSRTTGDIDMGSGTDTLTFAGAGSLTGNVSNVERIVKMAGGTFSFAGNANLSTPLAVTGGILELRAPASGDSVTVAAPGTTVDVQTTLLIRSGATLDARGGASSVSAGSSLQVDAGGTFRGNVAYSGTGTFARVDGAQEGDVVVSGGASLSGTGTLTGNATIGAGGTLSPGNSPGTLTIAGNLELQSPAAPGGSLTIAEITGTANDLIDVKRSDANPAGTGQATLGGTLEIRAPSIREIRTTRTVPIISAAGGFTSSPGVVTPAGQAPKNFDSIIGTSSSASVSVGTEIVNVENSGDNAGPDLFNVVLTRNTFASFGREKTTTGVGTALDQFVAGTGTALDPLVAALDALPTRDAVVNALNQLEAEPYDSLAQIAYVQAQLTGSQMEQYLRTVRAGLDPHLGPVVVPRAAGPAGRAPVPAIVSGHIAPLQKANRFADLDSRIGGFGTVYTYDGNQDTILDDRAVVARTGFNFSSRGAMAGIDTKVNDHIAIGLMGGSSDIKSELARGRGRADGDQWHAGAYGTWTKDELYADVFVSVHDYSFSTIRNVSFPGFQDTLRASQNAKAWSVYYGAGSKHHFGEWEWGPRATFQRTNFNLDAFSETGGTASLTLLERDVHSLRSQLGVRASRRIELERDITVVPDFRAAWAHEFDTSDTAILAQFNGGGGPFTSFAALPDRNSITVGASVNVFFLEHLSAVASYDAELARRGLDLHAARAGLNIKF